MTIFRSVGEHARSSLNPTHNTGYKQIQNLLFLCGVNCVCVSHVRDLLLAMAEKAAQNEEDRINFLLGPFVAQILRTWAEAVSVTVFDLEISNAVS